MPAWTTEAPFKSPESAAISREHSAIFISNVNGYERNNAGFISRLSLSGDIEDLVWLDQINAPTGLFADGDTLWAIDFDRLLEIDIPSRRIRAIYPAPDENPLLNDVAVGRDGSVFVTGSATNTVYVLDDSALTVWLRDDDALQFANGIDVAEDHLSVAAYHLVSISRDDKSITRFAHEDVLFDLEGVMRDGAGGYYVSVIGDRPLFHLNASGVLSPMMKGASFVADFDLDGGLLVAPTGAGSIEAFQIEPAASP